MYIEYMMPVSSQTSRVLLADVIPWINNAKYSMHHAMTDLKFGRCTALSSSCPVTEASKLVTVAVESLSQTPSHQRGLYYIDDLLPHAPLEL